MSKIYKSSCVSIGNPKPIVNAFANNANIKKEKDKDTKEESASKDLEEYAGSIIEDAKQMYLKIIEEANIEVKNILKNAEAEAQNLMSLSRDEGYQEGFEAGMTEGKREAHLIIDEASEIRCFLDERKDAFYKEAEEQVLKLVLNIAKKVIGEELMQNEEAILSLINQALTKCAFKKTLVLRVSQEDSEFIVRNKGRICKMVEGISDIDIIPDLSLAKGSCIIETPSGEINSGMDVQLKEVENIFNFVLRNE